jgi:dTDP-glucose pyrophosphorylase
MKQYIVSGEQLRHICLQPEQDIRTALTIISDSGAQIALVTSTDGKLIGTITDGDIRRALLKGSSLDSFVSTVMNVGFESVTEDSTSSINPIAVIRSKDIRHLPVIDGDGQLVSLYMTFEIAKEAKKNEIPVVIMAGGLGSRLRPLTETSPKPLLELGGKPILERILITLVTQGFNNFYFSVNYLSDMIENYFGDGHRWNANIRYLHEPSRLGTAGSLGEIEETITTPIIVQNGDLITDFSYQEMVDFHAKSGGMATMGLRTVHTQIEFGVVESDGNKISNIVEKPNLEHLVNAGIYCLSPEVLSRIKRGRYLDMPNLFIDMIDEGKTCSGYNVPGSWLDIGTHAELSRAQALFDEK